MVLVGASYMEGFWGHSVGEFHIDSNVCHWGTANFIKAAIQCFVLEFDCEEVLLLVERFTFNYNPCSL